MDNAQRHKAILDALHDTYVRKNADYGNSFGDLYSEFGILSSIIRISDKYNRLKSLANSKEIKVADESISDTLLDMANYCIMTVMEIESATKAKGDGKNDS